MAMQKALVIRDTHTKLISAVVYNPLRHEIMAGCEDGVIKIWDCVGENVGKLIRQVHEHQGWINCFLFWGEGKVVFSAGNDGKLLAWGSSPCPVDCITVGSPIYCAAWNARRGLLILGLNAALKVYVLKDPAESGGKIVNQKPFTARDHTDLIKGLVSHETRVYSAGYDRKLCIYEAYAYPGKIGLKLVMCIGRAHEAGITTLVLARDNENNTWLLTGSFDRSVKVWSQDGQIMHKFDGLCSAVTGLCYVSPTRTVWVAAGSPDAIVFDPKSGDNVSEFIGTFQNKEQESERHELILLHFVPDLNKVVATSSRRHILMWKYNPTGCITALKNRSAVECLTYTKKIPLLLFTGDCFGDITKWEQLQSNTFMYSKEHLPHSEALARLAAQIAERYDWVGTDKRRIKEELLSKKSQMASMHGKEKSSNFFVPDNRSLMKLVFVEELDLLLAASEDGNIYVWGFDYGAVQVLKQMKPADVSQVATRFGFLLHQNKKVAGPAKDTAGADENQRTPDLLGESADSVTNRVAGFVCKQVFLKHTQCVTGMAIVGRSNGYQTTFLLTSGWDRRLILWDLEQLRLHDVFRNKDNVVFENEELAADGIILDLTYCDERNEFAYASADKLVYIRKFSDAGSDMVLKAVLQGHEAEVTQVRWNAAYQKWVTGSEDSTIRVWSSDGFTCDMIFSSHGSVTAMCIDTSNGCIVAGVLDTIRVYDIGLKNIVQTNVGHADAIRCLLYIPERNQYVSASWDKTVRIWNTYRKSSRKKAQELDLKVQELD